MSVSDGSGQNSCSVVRCCRSGLAIAEVEVFEISDLWGAEAALSNGAGSMFWDDVPYIIQYTNIGRTDPMLAVSLNTMASIRAERDEFAVLGLMWRMI